MPNLKDSGVRAEKPVLDELRRLNKGGILLRMARNRQIIELRCEMPQCYCHKGRKYFDENSHPPTKWAPSADHYPRLKTHGGHLSPENVRVGHVACNRKDYGWRKRVMTMLAKGMSLEEIAERLNRKGIVRPHGHAKWSAATVRKAYVS